MIAAHVREVEKLLSRIDHLEAELERRANVISALADESARRGVELDRLRGAAQIVHDVYDHYPTRGWRELASLRRALLAS